MRTDSGVTLSMQSRVPSPPSANGAMTISSYGRVIFQPSARAVATCALVALPLNESGAIRIFATGKEYLSFGSLISSALDSWLWSRLDHLSIYCLLR
jgi:hypothetical protein